MLLLAKKQTVFQTPDRLAGWLVVTTRSQQQDFKHSAVPAVTTQSTKAPFLLLIQYRNCAAVFMQFLSNCKARALQLIGAQFCSAVYTAQVKASSRVMGFGLLLV